jgi:hypothetical protein
MIESDSLLDETWSTKAGAGRSAGEQNELRRVLEIRPTRIVAMGGGTGLPMVLKGLARRATPKPGP